MKWKSLGAAELGLISSPVRRYEGESRKPGRLVKGEKMINTLSVETRGSVLLWAL